MGQHSPEEKDAEKERGVVEAGREGSRVKGGGWVIEEGYVVRVVARLISQFRLARV